MYTAIIIIVLLIKFVAIMHANLIDKCTVNDMHI